MFSNTLPSKSPSPSLLNCPSNPPSRQPSDPSEADSPKKAGKWTSEEDELLRKYVSMFSEKQWKKISDYIPGRTPIQCLHRWTKILKPGLVKGPWTQDEDQKLLDWIKKHGPGKWAQAATVIPGRSGKQCRERWFNNLNPDVKKGNWSTEEDKLIFDLYQKHGSSWSKISKYIPGRTENSIKNRFYSTLRKLAATKNKDGMGNAGNTGSTGSDARSNGSNQEDLLVKQEDVALKNRDKNEPLLARNSNIKPKVNEKMEKMTAPNEHLQLPVDQQKALQSLLAFLQTPAAETPMIPLQKPLVLAPQFQVPLINTRINEELKQMPFGQGLLSAPLSFGNRSAIENLDLLSGMFRENANQNKLQFPLQSHPQVPTGGLDALIRSISDDIATASIVYTHGLSSINELLSSNNNSEEAREKVNELFRQVYGLESWLKNAKAELARLESLVHAQRLFAQLPLEASAINKRMLFGANENVEDQQYLVKKRKVE